ncbi:MAG: endonuclease III [Thermoplasmata archaeon]
MDEKIEIVIKILMKKISPHKIPYNEPWKVLISTVLSQRTKDETTATVSKRLFEKYPNLNDLANAKNEDLEILLKPIGFYREKAKRIKEIARIILDDYGGNVPKEKDLLLKLPGVGTKTANIVLSVSYSKDYIAVDTHVHRISNRLGWVKTKTPEETELELMKIIDRSYWKIINSVLVEFGKSICRPKGPRCDICPVSNYCPSSRIVAKK